MSATADPDISIVSNETVCDREQRKRQVAGRIEGNVSYHYMILAHMRPAEQKLECLKAPMNPAEKGSSSTTFHRDGKKKGQVPTLPSSKFNVRRRRNFLRNSIWGPE